MTYEQKLKLKKELFEQERQYLKSWDDAIKEHYKRKRRQLEERGLL